MSDLSFLFYAKRFGTYRQTPHANGSQNYYHIRAKAILLFFCLVSVLVWLTSRKAPQWRTPFRLWNELPLSLLFSYTYFILVRDAKPPKDSCNWTSTVIKILTWT